MKYIVACLLLVSSNALSQETFQFDWTGADAVTTRVNWNVSGCRLHLKTLPSGAWSELSIENCRDVTAIQSMDKSCQTFFRRVSITHFGIGKFQIDFVPTFNTDEYTEVSYAVRLNGRTGEGSEPFFRNGQTELERHDYANFGVDEDSAHLADAYIFDCR